MRTNKILCLVLTLFVVVSSVPSGSVLGADLQQSEKEYLLCDGFEYSLEPNMPPQAYTSEFSKNRLQNVDGTVHTTYVKTANKKGSNAFFLSTNGYTGTGQLESCIDYRYLPTVTSGDVTCEFSICAPVSSTSRAGARFILPVNDAIPVLAFFDEKKNIQVNGTKYGTWEAGKWYNIAVTLHIDTDVCDIYINGICFDKGVTLASAPNGINSVGGRVKVASMMMTSSNTTPADNLVGYDDIRIYKGDYSPLESMVAQTESCTPVDTWGQMYIDRQASAQELCGEFSTQAAVRAGSLPGQSVSGTVADGMYITVTYPTGVRSYEIVNPNGFNALSPSGYSYATASEMTKYYSGKSHPRVMIDSDDIKRIKSLNTTDAVIKNLYVKILRYADRYLDSDQIAYSTDSNVMLSNARIVRDHAYYFGMAYLLTGDECYPERMWEDLKAAGEFSDWAETLNFLVVGEMTGAFGVAYDWMYDYWSDEQREFIEQTIINLGFSKCLRAYRGTMNGISSSSSWISTGGNWNSVCNGGTLIAATAIYEADPMLCSVMSSNAVRGLGYMMHSFNPDGAWEEGAGYWSYMMRYLTTALDVLDMNFNTDFKLDEAPGLYNTAEFVRATCGSVGSNNFHDTEFSEGKFSSEYLYWLAERFSVREYFDERSEQIIHENQGYIYDLLFYNPDKSYVNGTSIGGLDAYFRDVELVSMRSGYSDDALYLSYHAGETTCSHGHADDGTFVFDMIGERWAIDLGPDSYTLPSYNGAKRYNYYRTRSEGQNTLVINPDASSGQLANTFAPASKPVDTGKVVYSITDLTDAYSDNAAKVQRGFMLTDNRTNIVIRDEISLKAVSDVYWFMHTDATIKLADSKTAVLTKNGKSITMKLQSNASSAAFSVMDAVPLATSPQYDGQNTNDGIKKLTVTARENGNVYFQISASADENFGFKDTPISQWNNIRSESLISENFDDEVFSGKVTSGSASISDAGYGKKSKVLSLKANSVVEYNVSAADEDKATAEFSVQAFSGNKVLTSGSPLVSFNSNGNVEFAGEAVCKWTSGYWYNFAVVFSDESTDLYINGEYAATSDSVSFNGFSICNGAFTSGYDDIKVYNGEYSPKVDSLSFKRSYYVKNGTIFIPGKISADDLVSLALTNMEMSIYSDIKTEVLSDYATAKSIAVLSDKDNGIVKYYTFSTNVEYDEYLYCDMERAKNLPDNKGLSSTMYFGEISSTELKNTDGITTYTSVKESGNGKNGVSYYFNKNNASNTNEMTLDFKFLPQINSGTVTFEISVKAPSGSAFGKDNLMVYIPYNTSYKKMIDFRPDGYIAFNNHKYEKYREGAWYNFAVSFHVGTRLADFYMNGVWLGTNELWSFHNSDKIDYIGGRFRLSSQITGLEDGETYTGTAAFDNIMVYGGHYYPELYNPVLMLDGSNANSINLDSSCTKESFLKKLSGSIGEINIFEDENFGSLVSNYISDGQVLSISTDSIVRYFDINVKNGLKISGTSVHATYDGEATLYFVKYNDSGVLENVEKHDFEKSCTKEIPDGCNAVMLWTKGGVKPLCERIDI